MNYFVYKGVRSSDMGLRIEKKEVFSAPKYDMEFLSIPGRSGELIAGGGRFPNTQITYSVFLPAKSIAELSQKITAVKGWLYSGLDSYHELSDTYDTEFTRAAVYAGKLDIEDEMNRIGIFTISFSCKPFRYAVAGAKSQLVGNGQNLTNPYSFPSQPIIRVVGSGKGTLTIQSESSNATWEFTDIDEFVEIDSEQMNCYKNTEPKNDTVGGNGFPILYPGENTFSFTGGIQGISVTPRWCSI